MVEPACWGLVDVGFIRTKTAMLDFFLYIFLSVPSIDPNDVPYIIKTGWEAFKGWDWIRSKYLWTLWIFLCLISTWRHNLLQSCRLIFSISFLFFWVGVKRRPYHPSWSLNRFWQSSSYYFRWSELSQ